MLQQFVRLSRVVVEHWFGSSLNILLGNFLVLVVNSSAGVIRQGFFKKLVALACSSSLIVFVTKLSRIVWGRVLASR